MSALLGFQAVEQAFIAAALDGSCWNDAMDAAARESRSVGSVLLPFKGRMTIVPQSPSLGEISDFYFREGWNLRDERDRGLATMTGRGVLVDLDIVSEAEINRTAYYQDFLGRFGMRWFAGVPIKADDDLWILSIQRAIADGPFSMPEQRRLARWGKRLSIAAKFARQLSEARSAGGLDVLENLGAAAISLSRLGNVVRANSLATGMMCPEFRIQHGRIAIVHRGASAEVDGALRLVLAFGNGVRALGPLPVPREDKRPLLLHLISLDGQDANPFAPSCAIMLIADPDARTPSKAEHFVRTLGLTPAEAKFAALLAAGTSLADAADALHITEETARSRLKSIFLKTETNKQGGLVALLARIAGPFST